MNYLIDIVLLVIAAVFNSEMDTIQFNPSKAWFKFDWWIKNNWKYDSKVKQFIMRYLLFMFKDGWHLCKSIMIICFVAMIAENVYEGLVYYAVFSTVFNICFHN